MRQAKGESLRPSGVRRGETTRMARFHGQKLHALGEGRENVKTLTTR
jgi:hypothetical protein